MEKLFPLIAERSLNLALAGLVFSLIALGLTNLLRRSHPLVQSATLVAVVVGLVLLPVVSPLLDGLGFSLARIDFPTSTPRLDTSDRTSPPTVFHQDSGAVPLEASPGMLPRALPAEAQNHVMSLPLQVNIALVITLIWILGIFGSLVRRLVSTIRLRQFKAQLPKITDNQILAIWESLADLKRGHIALLQGPPGASPMTFGIFSPCVVLPSDISEHLSVDELRAVLAHELAHIRNRDALLGLIQYAITAFYWWNPFVHVLLRRLSLLREMISDGAASNHLNPAAYASMLLRLAERTNTATPAASQVYGVLLNPSKHPLEQRFRMLTRFHDNSNNQSVTMKQTITIYLTIIAATILCTTIQTSFAQENEISEDAEIHQTDPAIPKTTPESQPHAPHPVQKPHAPRPPHPPVAPISDDHGGEVSRLKTQVRELQRQIEKLKRQSKKSVVQMNAQPVEQRFEQSHPLELPNVEQHQRTVRPERGRRIDLNRDGILSDDGPGGKAIRFDINSEIAESFSGIIEGALKAAAQEMESAALEMKLEMKEMESEMKEFEKARKEMAIEMKREMTEMKKELRR